MTSCPTTIKEAVKLWDQTLKPMAASDEMTGILSSTNINDIEHFIKLEWNVLLLDWTLIF